ncbi:hypothetical protein [Litoreibacter halocynthiae]|uniref:hypothetical protein n=1 Tax=Litoreibacter halocynthiae TaxID=1242689 RepID=UPI00248FAAED|nr:hypothetical protein [Litoreibacter halocynthiae]
MKLTKIDHTANYCSDLLESFMLITFEETIELAKGVWLSKTNTSDLQILRSNGSRRAAKSVVVLENPEYSASKKRISANLESAYLINEGNDEHVILLESRAALGTFSLKTTAADKRDVPFIDSCKNLGLRSETIELITQFLNRLRAEGVEDELEEGKARKWIMRPNNFVTITPQTRNMCFRISVRETEVCHNTSKIDWKTGLPTYREFAFSELGQLEDAVAVALGSAKK